MRWPTPDWDEIGPVYRTIKYAATRPVKAVCRVQARGIEHLPMEGGALVAVNHWSYWDPVLVADVLPRPLVHLAKSELFQSRFGRWFFQEMSGQIPVDRRRGGNEAALLQAAQAVRDGRVVAVYPEGTRSLPPDLLPGHTGVARLAFLTGAPVVPVGCLSDRFWSMRQRVPKFGERVYVEIGEPFRVAFDADLAADREATRKVTSEVMQRIRQLLDSAAAARERGEAWPWKPQNGRLLSRRKP